jgi:hypothetical protein
MKQIKWFEIESSIIPSEGWFSSGVRYDGFDEVKDICDIAKKSSEHIKFRIASVTLTKYFEDESNLALETACNISKRYSYL